MGYSQIVRGTRRRIARGINVSNAHAEQQGLATVNPDLHLGAPCAARAGAHPGSIDVPEGVRLVAGTTATVQVDSDRNRR